MIPEKNTITKIGSMAIIGSVILTVSAIIASLPATTFLVMYAANLQGTGALVAGGFFSLLAVILWISAVRGWQKVYRTRTS